MPKLTHVVGVEFGVAGGGEEEFAGGERGGVEGVSGGGGCARPLVRAHEVADVHVGYGAAVDLIGVVEGVPEGDEGGQETVEAPETTRRVGWTGGLRRVRGHEGRVCGVVFFPTIGASCGCRSEF